MVSIEVKDGEVHVKAEGIRVNCLADMNIMFKILVETYAKAKGITNEKSVIELMQMYMLFGIKMGSNN